MDLDTLPVFVLLSVLILLLSLILALVAALFLLLIFILGSVLVLCHDNFLLHGYFGYRSGSMA